MKKLIIFLCFIIALSACSDRKTEIIGYTVLKTDISETSFPPQIFFCPADRCDLKLFQLFDAANSSIHCALFDLDLPILISKLQEKAEIIDVKLVVDNNNFKDVGHLQFVKPDTNNQLSHNKFCIIDNYVVSTGSFNPTERGAFYNNNNLLILHSHYLSENYEQEFDELWLGKFGKGDMVPHPTLTLNNNTVENYFCPEDDCANNIKELIKNAKHSVYFMTFSFTEDSIANALVMKHHEGLDIKGVFEKTQASQYSKYELLKFQGIDVKLDNNKYNMHHKVFIIDEEIVVSGSFNPTDNGNENNDENIIIIHDKVLASKFLDEFEYVYNYNNILMTTPTAAKDIILHTVYYDAPGADTGKEYITLFNPTDEEIDIDHYRIEKDSSLMMLLGTIKPHASLVIKPSFSLPNTAAAIILRNLKTEQIDYAGYDGESEGIVRTDFTKANCKDCWSNYNS